VQQQKTYRQQVFGQMESFLNISGIDQLLDAIHGCYVSLFTNRAIKYRHDMGFTKLDIAISVGVQQMVRSDKLLQVLPLLLILILVFKIRS
jgi:phosphoenolpyruvate synthase/pyruvate phosphate dikinase